MMKASKAIARQKDTLIGDRPSAFKGSFFKLETRNPKLETPIRVAITATKNNPPSGRTNVPNAPVIPAIAQQANACR